MAQAKSGPQESVETGQSPAMGWDLQVNEEG